MPALARLSFWVPAEEEIPFERDFTEKLMPILVKHQLVDVGRSGRAGVPGILSRLFEVTGPGQIMAQELALATDAEWSVLLAELGTKYGTSSSAGPLRFSLRICSTPAGPGTTAEIGPAYRQGLWHSFSVRSGLPDAIVNDILQDRSGNLWFGTTCGVSKFDGAQLTTFTTEDGLVDNRVRALAEMRDGSLWFGTQAGVSRFDGIEFVSFTVEDGLAHDFTYAIKEDRHGELWLGTKEGLSWFDGKVFQSFAIDDSPANVFNTHARFTADSITAGMGGSRVLSIAEDRSGNLWFGTQEGASRFDGERLTSFTVKDGLAGTWVQAIHEDRDGQMWFAFQYGDGVSRFDGKEFTTLSVDDGLASNKVLAIAEDQGANLWFGTFDQGVCRYNGTEFRSFEIEDGLANNQVLSIGADKVGNLWFGTKGSGVTRFAGAQFAAFTTRDGLIHNGVLSMLQDREGDFWFGTFKGACRLGEDGFSSFDANRGLTDEGVDALLEDASGQIWFGTPEAVSRQTEENFRSFSIDDGLATDAVWTMLEDRSGSLWFGGAERRIGVTRYDGKTFTRFDADDGLVHNSVMDILEDSHGFLWFATQEGVSRFDGQAFTNFTVKNGLVNDDLTSIVADRDGNLWFGSAGGVSRFDGTRFVNFTTADGLSHNVVECMMVDRRGHLWFGTFGGGVCRYDGIVFQSLDKHDGLIHDTIQEMVEDPQGDVWIATEGGVTRYRPHHTPPVVRVTHVVADRRYEPEGQVLLPAANQLVTFEFQGLSFSTYPDDMIYLCLLEGRDTDWHKTSHQHAEYQDLSPGDYRFQVMAVDRDLNYSQPAMVRVTVVPDPRIEALNQAVGATNATVEFIGNSPALRYILGQLAEVASTDVTVFISGETGAGKGLAARCVHGSSTRKAGPFIQVNCGAIPENLVESELFGHERGAFTGAMARRPGKIELADGGTLFLDEIGDLPLPAQVKLLHFLDDRTFERVGGTENLNPDVRIIAATNRDLQQMVASASFREDLYFRLKVFPVRLPPLRERREDIQLLASHFVAAMAAHLGKRVTHLAPDAMKALQAYDWPGNVRELEHEMQRAVIVCRGEEVLARDIALGRVKNSEDPVEELVQESVDLQTLERRYICLILEQTGWVIGGQSGAATVLGLNESTLRGRMRKLKITRP